MAATVVVAAVSGVSVAMFQKIVAKQHLWPDPSILSGCSLASGFLQAAPARDQSLDGPFLPVLAHEVAMRTISGYGQSAPRKVCVAAPVLRAICTAMADVAKAAPMTCVVRACFVA